MEVSAGLGTQKALLPQAYKADSCRKSLLFLPPDLLIPGVAPMRTEPAGGVCHHVFYPNQYITQPQAWAPELTGILGGGGLGGWI